MRPSQDLGYCQSLNFLAATFIVVLGDARPNVPQIWSNAAKPCSICSAPSQVCWTPPEISSNPSRHGAEAPAKTLSISARFQLGSAPKLLKGRVASGPVPSQTRAVQILGSGAEFCPSPANSGKTRPAMFESRPNSAEVGPNRCRRRQTSANVDQRLAPFRPILDRRMLVSAKFRSESTNVDTRDLHHFDLCWTDVCRFRPKLLWHLPNLPDFRQTCAEADIDQPRPKLD